jgi:hypothetical protein|tara:strand:- start:1324 stop:1731 length:408 start_codon:yes stop_codon:yes gene_type:complete
MINDDDIMELCNNMIRYITKETEIESIISYLLREIKVNDLIYINLNDTWYYYNSINKIWEQYDFRKILFNLENLYNFFNEIIKNYLEISNDLTEKNKTEILRISHTISQAFLDRNINYNKLQKFCKKLFSIRENI